MSRFTNVLVVSPYPDGKTWYLRGDFGYDVGAEGSGRTIIVPEGFTTDFASVPRPLWSIFPKWGKYGNAAVIHDYLYFVQLTTRKETDGIFLEAMGILNVSGWQKWPIYWGVRLFGFIAWYMNAGKKRLGYSKITSVAPLKATDVPIHWKTRKGDLKRILFKRNANGKKHNDNG